MAYEKGSRPEGGFKRRGPARRRKKVCVFCGKENNEIDYKDVAKLKKYVSASESADSSNQESKTYFSYAVRSGLIREMQLTSEMIFWSQFFCAICLQLTVFAVVIDICS